jgi:hypothetical protein
MKLAANACPLAIAAIAVLAPLRVHAASLKGGANRQLVQDESGIPGEVMGDVISAKAIVLAQIKDEKLGMAEFLSYDGHPGVAVNFKTRQGEDGDLDVDVLTEFMLRESSDIPDPVTFFKFFAERSGQDIDPPDALIKAVDIVLAEPVSDEEKPENMVLPHIPELEPSEKSDFGNRRQLGVGDGDWFKNKHCSYPYRWMPDPDVCGCYTDFTASAGVGGFYSYSSFGLVQKTYNFFAGFNTASLGHRLDLCVGTSGNPCSWLNLMNDSVVNVGELSTLWHFSSGLKVYRTLIYDTDTDMFHVSVNELNFYIPGPSACWVGGHGCYTCPNIY